MSSFAIVDDATGEVRSFATDDPGNIPDVLPPGLVKVAIPREPQLRDRWNKTTRQLDLDVAPSTDYGGSGKTLLDTAKADWTTATGDWNAAFAMAQGTQGEIGLKILAELKAVREGQVAIVEGLRALGRVVLQDVSQ